MTITQDCLHGIPLISGVRPFTRLNQLKIFKRSFYPAYNCYITERYGNQSELVEISGKLYKRTENPRVGSSILSLGTIFFRTHTGAVQGLGLGVSNLTCRSLSPVIELHVLPSCRSFSPALR